MYGKTSLGAEQLTGKLSPRRKRALAGAGIIVVLGLGGLTAWTALAPDPGPGAGCVDVTVPSSTGGATLHYCGSAARSFCQNAFVTTTQLTLRARPPCRQAGLGPTATP
jgi:hypothetical protein